ncbi:hypothetical protein VQ7734_02880 [Vibrio quintilis]|uniref:Uncharacterized protein n=1 Tax=Vibrio quintilis TaxID=1117707 RepID=A0A1M7YWW4_9VIBR|nr:hypothetical protein VQ7734_02880 [Vibrio quintilis]
MPFTVRQNSQLADFDSLLRLFQRRHQGFQRLTNHRRHPLTTNLRIDFKIKTKSRAGNIINRQSERIIGSFFSGYHFNTLPDAFHLFGLRRCMAALIAVVKQGGKQRRLRCDTTALLHQRQRGMFIIQQFSQPGMGGLYGICDRDVVQRQTQRQRIQEHPQRPVSTVAARHPAKQDGAEHHIIPAGRRPDHQAPG